MKKLDNTLTHIANADDSEMSEIIQAIIKRYSHIHPDWEIMFLSLPRYDTGERRRILSDFCRLLETHSI